jgi:hypothetical protein
MLQMTGFAVLFSPAFVRSLALGLLVVVGAASPAGASDKPKYINARATGQIISQGACPDSTPETPLTCQTATITGNVSHIGRITGVLNETISADGSYTGEAVFTTPNGDTFTTAYRGQVLEPQPDGAVRFVEWHELVGGTGRFAESSGNLFVLGSATASGQIAIEGTGALVR